jgi:predicted membrane channel-forming protein YqfA (hemolysin III family)
MRWNLIAAILGTIAGALTTAATILLYDKDPSLINVLGVGAGVFGTLCGICWTAAAIRE